jgi:peptidyl-tRNA hydrolase, PTH1 family
LLKWMKSLLSFPNAATKEYLIVGLGNPGKAYERTRHNVGFRAARHFGERHSITLKKAHNMSAEIGTGRVGTSSIGVLLPLTYMNSSGEAVLHAMKAFKVPSERIAVVVDDIALPVGDLRFKESGSSGGHNGLKSIEEHLGTSDFPRLRIGVGHPGGGDLADFVLSPFEKGEETQLPEVFNKVADAIDCWILQGMQKAMGLANTKKNQ